MHKKAVLKLASGFRGRAGNCIRIARERVEKALQYATRDRRAKKRDVRSLWIARINAGAREHGVSSCGLVSPYFSSTFVWMLSCSARKEVGAFERERARNWLVIISNRPSSDGLGFLRSPLPKKIINLLQLTYSTFIAGLKAENIALNRKILSDFAEKEPLSFGALAARVRALQERGGGKAG